MRSPASGSGALRAPISRPQSRLTYRCYLAELQLLPEAKISIGDSKNTVRFLWLTGYKSSIPRIILKVEDVFKTKKIGWRLGSPGRILLLESAPSWHESQILHFDERSRRQPRRLSKLESETSVMAGQVRNFLLESIHKLSVPTNTQIDEPKYSTDKRHSIDSLFASTPIYLN
jgi:hypothetical protein